MFGIFFSMLVKLLHEDLKRLLVSRLLIVLLCLLVCVRVRVRESDCSCAFACLCVFQWICQLLRIYVCISLHCFSAMTDTHIQNLLPHFIKTSPDTRTISVCKRKKENERRSKPPLVFVYLNFLHHCVTSAVEGLATRPPERTTMDGILTRSPRLKVVIEGQKIELFFANCFTKLSIMCGVPQQFCCSYSIWFNYSFVNLLNICFHLIYEVNYPLMY